MKQRNVVIYTMLAIILCIIFMIVSLFTIWKPKKVQKKESFDGRKKVYSYIENKNFQEKAFNLYKSEVKRLLMPVNINQLFEKLDEDYIEDNKLEKNNVKEFLEEKKLLSNNIEIKKYSVIKKADTYIYRTVYDVFDSNNSKINEGVVNIIEEKPFEYTLSFESDAISILENNITAKINNISFDIKNIENKKDSVKYEIKFTNENEEDINIDFDDINNVVLILENGKQIKMAASLISSSDEILTKGSSLKKEAFFSVSLAEQGLIKAIKFNKVTIGNKVTNIKIEF